MSGKRRRNPSLAGLAGLTASDLDALDQGRTTLQTIADRVGCSKQAVSRKIRAMKAASPAATSPISTSTGPASIPAGGIAVNAHEISVSACLGLLHRAHAALIGPDALGPSALKALSTTISTATAELRLFGVLASDDDESTLSTLTVRVMTQEEHDAQKLKSSEKDDFHD